MEEILASIRRIISEDGATVESNPVETAELPVDVASVPSSVDIEMTDMDLPVLDLIEEVTEDGSVQSLPPEPAPKLQQPPIDTIELDMVYDSDSLLSQSTAQASANALSGLSRMLNGGGVNISSQPIGDGHKTLESMVLELLRPILKDWLDQNLPTIVERIVQKEIQKITRDLG